MDFFHSMQKAYVENTDKRVMGWLLMETPWPTISILAFYCFCIYYGPKYMENRKPINLKNVLLIYNLGQVIFSTYLFTELLIVSIKGGQFSLQCQPIDYSDNPFAVRMARCQWLYFITKIVELLDTVFFVARKKNSQISVLHVYHHVVMAFSWYFVVRFIAGGQVFFLPMINSFVHILMYTYYCLSAMGPRIQPYLWWKKYLTKIQMLQFAGIIFHGCYILFNPSCSVPKLAIIHCMGTTAIVALLFANFYYQTYLKSTNRIKHKQR